MNPYKLKDVFNYLTSNNQLLKRKLKLGTSEIPIPPKRSDVTTIEAINRFNKANPRVDTTSLKPLSVKHSNVRQSNVGQADEGVIQGAFDTATREAQQSGFPAPSYDKFKSRYLKKNMKADGGRIGYKDGPKFDVQASGSKSGKQQIANAPKGITSDKELINAILTMDIPLTEKINLIGNLQYGKDRNRIEYKDNEIFLQDPKSYRDRNIGLDYNRGGEGFSGSATVGDRGPEFFLKYKKSFADGGVAGLLGERTGFRGGGYSYRSSKTNSPGHPSNRGKQSSSKSKSSQSNSPGHPSNKTTNPSTNKATSGGGGGGGRNNKPPKTKTKTTTVTTGGNSPFTYTKKPKTRVNTNTATYGITSNYMNPTFRKATINFLNRQQPPKSFIDNLKNLMGDNVTQIGLNKLQTDYLDKINTENIAQGTVDTLSTNPSLRNPDWKAGGFFTNKTPQNVMDEISALNKKSTPFMSNSVDPSKITYGDKKTFAKPSEIQSYIKELQPDSKQYFFGLPKDDPNNKYLKLAQGGIISLRNKK